MKDILNLVTDKKLEKFKTEVKSIYDEKYTNAKDNLRKDVGKEFSKK